MTENIYIRLAGQHVEWLVMDPAEQHPRLRGEAPIDELGARLADITWLGSTVVLLQAEDVLLTRASVPSKQARQILQAVPFAVEEQLASDIEDCHFALGGRYDSGEVSVAVVDRRLFEQRLDSLRQVNICPEIVLVDVLQVPLDGSVSLLVDHDRLLIRTGAAAGLSFPLEQMAQAIGLLSVAQRADLIIRVAADQRETIDLAVNQVNAEYNMSCSVVEQDLDSLEYLCRGLDWRGLNLLQGEFQVKQPSTGRRGIWRSVAILGLVAFVLHLTVLFGQGLYLERQAQEFELAAQQLYAEIFPTDRNVNDIRRRWRAKLADAGNNTNSDFVSLFAAAAKNLPGSNLVLGNINYNDSRGDLILQVTASRSETMVAFVQQLTVQGLKAEIGTISQEADVVKGSIKIKSGGGA
ncbi:MAG: type II secretion system protein GspL [SAR86 cluster bacterium]|jgi:general secretion pathway protein L|tara:strand:- start:28912 stop:30138 length:1227 start_codon:yes stop_codon:yes gene_type:complete